MRKPSSEPIHCSIVIPVMNEEENVPILHERVTEVMQKLGRPYEIIMIDDGSSDRTFTELEKIAETDEHVRVIKFRCNFGQSAATAAGFDLASGEVIITMDGDLQNNPADIPKIITKLNEGYDVVSGWRKNRKDEFLFRKVPSIIANRIICRVTNVQLHDTGCALKAYRTEIVKKISLYGELHRFLPALTKIEGAKIAEMSVHHHPRIHGKSKYNLKRTYKVIMDLLSLFLFIRYLRHPAYFFGVLGLGFVSLAVLLLAWMSLAELVGEAASEEFNNLLTVIFLFFATGFQMLFVGLLGELIVKTGQRRNVYLLEGSTNH